MSHSVGEPWIWATYIVFVLIMLAFIGAKMLIAPWYHVPVAASLAIIASLIATRK